MVVATGHNVSKVDDALPMDEHDYFMAQLPPGVRNYLEYDSPVPWNPKNIIERRNRDPFFKPSWEFILDELMKISHENHRQSFGGVHPSLDTPRQVW